MKVQMKLLVSLGVCFAVRYSLAEITPDAMLNTTLDAWTTVDTVRSIAREDRHHLYPKLIKANLDLYAATYWFTDQYSQDHLSEQYKSEISDIFHAMITAQKDTLTGQSISDDGQAPLLPWNPSVEVPLKQNSIGGLCSCMIMDHTNHLWKKFTMGSSATGPH
jgi:hypothetical protein